MVAGDVLSSGRPLQLFEAVFGADSEFRKAMAAKEVRGEGRCGGRGSVACVCLVLDTYLSLLALCAPIVRIPLVFSRNALLFLNVLWWLAD